MPILVKKLASSGFKFLSAAIITAITIGAMPTCMMETAAVTGDKLVKMNIANNEITNGIKINLILKPSEMNLIMLLSRGSVKLQPMDNIVSGVNKEPNVDNVY